MEFILRAERDRCLHQRMAVWNRTGEIRTGTGRNTSGSWLFHSWSVSFFSPFDHLTFLIFLALPRPIHGTNIYARNLGIVLGIMGFSLIFIVLGLGLCYQKSRQSGHYKTKEDQGADQAIDADTAIIRGDPRHPDLMEAKEWFF